MEDVLNAPGLEAIRRKMADFMVTLPNHIAYSFQLPYDCKGQECLDKVCAETNFSTGTLTLASLRPLLFRETKCALLLIFASGARA